jgi:tetratricopeptide (TPR) repeat protein
MARTLRTKGIDQFLNFYRFANTRSLAARQSLGFFYYSRGRYSEAAAQLMDSFLIETTVSINRLLAASPDYSFTSLKQLFVDNARDKVGIAWLKQNDYYKTCYWFACALYALKQNLPAQDLWSFLSARDDAGEWQSRAKAQLSQPHPDTSLETL